MRWFGGHSGKGNGRLPVDAYLLWGRPAIWVCGAWPDHHARVVTSLDDTQAIVVIGPCSATDHELATLVGRDVPDSAVTDWAGAYTIITARPGQVTIWTDPAGACPIYTARDDDGALIWASSSRALASLTNAAVNEAWLARFLANPRLETEDSAFCGVTMMPPGCRLVLTNNHVEDLAQIWTPRPRHWPEAVDQLQTTLEAAVRLRVERARPAVDLSGGMDSTTLAVLAAQHCSVMTVTVHPDGVTSGGDLDHARTTAAAHRGMWHVLLPLTDEHLPYSSLDDLPATDEPAPSTVTWARLAAQLQLLADAAVTCHLTGDGGDTLFLPPPVYLADLVRRGRWLRLAADVQGWARLRRVSPWPLLSEAVHCDTSPHAAAAPPWLTACAKRLSATRSITIAMPNFPDHADRDLVARTRFTARTAHTETQLADAFDIAMHNPYLDARVLDIVLGVPGWLRGSPRQYKPLLTAATAGLLPETVRHRAAKGTFASDHHQGLRRNLHHVLELTDGQLADRGLITPERVRAEIRTAAAGLPIRWGHLQRVLAAEIWLRSIETADPVEWAVPETKVGAA